MTSADRFAAQEKMSIAEILAQESSNETKPKPDTSQTQIRPEWMRLTVPKLEMTEDQAPKGYPLREDPKQDITHKTAADTLLSHNAFSSTSAMKVPGTDKLIKLTLPSKRAKADHQMWEMMVGKAYVSLNTKSYVPDETKRKYFEYVQDHIACNGTMGGLVWRMTRQLPKYPSKLSEVHLYSQYIASHFLLSPVEELEPRITDRPDFMDSRIFEVNPSASPGFPNLALDAFAKTDRKAVEQALVTANKYLDILETDDDKLTNFGLYVRDHPVETLLAVKRKNERMPVGNYWTKVRPYYVYPLAIKLLFLWTSHYLEEHIVPFWEDYNSNSAYKFSWFYGGCQKIVDVILKTSELAKDSKLVRFKAICFGDDQYWIFCLPDGRIFLFGPDVAGMDMSCSPRSGTILQYLVRAKWSPPFLFRKVLQAHMVLAFVGYFHLAGAYQLMKAWGLFSGVPATTIIDIFNSVLIHAVVSHLVDKHNSTLTDGPRIQEFIHDVVLVAVKRELGFEFKKDTLNFQEWKRSEDIAIPFLGMLIKYNADKDAYYPVPEKPEKLGCTLVLPTESGKHISQPPYAMERMYGALLSGGWSDPFLESVIRHAYSEYAQKGYYPRNPGDLNIGMSDAKEYFEFKAQPFVLHKRAPPLPSQVEIMDMCIMSKRDFVLKYMSQKWSPSFEKERTAPPEQERPKTPRSDNPFTFDFSNTSDIFKEHQSVKPEHVAKKDLPKSRPAPVQTSSSSARVDSRQHTSRNKKKGSRRTRIVEPGDSDVSIHSDDTPFYEDDFDLEQSERKLGGGPRVRYVGGFEDQDTEEVELDEESLFVRNFKRGRGPTIDSPD